MGSANEINVMLLVKLADDLLTKSETHASIVVSISLDAALGIRPKQVAKKSRVGHVSGPHNVFDLVKILQFRAQTSVHAENFLVDESGDGQTVEHVTEDTPKSNRVSTFALVIEAVNTIDLGTLVIATEQKEVLWVLNFVAEEKADRLNGLSSTVNVISEEEVVSFGWETAVFKNSQQVIILPMNITANLDWGFKFEQVWLADKNLARLGAQVLNILLR